MKWPLAGWGICILVTAAQVVWLVVFWGMPFLPVALAAVVILGQGMVFGARVGYDRGFRDGARHTDAARGEMVVRMPLLAGESYARLISKRDRVN